MVSRFSVAQAPSRPVFIYDSACGFCSRWVALWNDLAQDRVEFLPAQETRFREIPSGEYDRSSQFIDTDGLVYSGAEAVFRMFAFANGKGGWIWAYHHIRGFEALTEFVYAQVASHRSTLSQINRVLVSPELPHYAATRALFLRLLGFVYFCAFASLLPQVRGLWGAEGILPAQELLQFAEGQLTGAGRWIHLPTLCWWSAGDAFILFQCAAGTVLSVVLMAGFLPWLALPLLWVLWLSLAVIGRDFMAFQWENLLLEAGILAIFLAPVSWHVRHGERPSALVIFLFRWLLFRLMFMSGAVKLLSGDHAWWNFTALFYHFETQPLPTYLGWHAYQMPTWFMVLQTGVMYVVEIGFAFLIFAPRKLRLFAFGAFVLLQLGIAMTGNYGYFNLLAIVLCVLLLDDRFLRAAKGRVLPLRTWRNGVLISRSVMLVLASAIIVSVSSLEFFTALGLKRDWPKPMLGLYAMALPFRSINHYGLFAVMTKKRPEIIVQGSADGAIWKDYTFKYKPGALDTLPGWVAPRQPRLDWQMWFAALGSYEKNRWFTQFCRRLLEGSPAVLELLADNPFPDKPPRFIRAMVYDYEFTTSSQRAESGNYWVRKNERVYLPPVSIQPEP